MATSKTSTATKKAAPKAKPAQDVKAVISDWLKLEPYPVKTVGAFKQKASLLPKEDHERQMVFFDTGTHTQLGILALKNGLTIDEFIRRIAWGINQVL